MAASTTNMSMGDLLLARAAYYLIRLLGSTYRWEIINGEHLHAAQTYRPQGGYVLATWHHNTLASSLSQYGRSYCPLASSSRDGEFITYVFNRLGFETVRGSSSRGGSRAVVQMIRRVKAGQPTAITVDGPRGPKGVVKPGVIMIAARTQTPILPIAAVADRYWELARSWDRFRIPKPFARIQVRYGEPIHIEGDDLSDDMVDEGLELQRALDTLEA